MSPPPPKSESGQNSPHWDEYLVERLEEFESAVQHGKTPPLIDPRDLADCPPEIAAELRELQSLLLRVENGQPQVDAKPAGSTAGPDAEPATLPIPSAARPSALDKSWSDLRIGRFELGLKLGEGTYGFVYLAQDPHLKRLVALKIPRLDAAFRDDLRERFIREGESAARLTHPNIVTVFEAASEGPVSFIASEYIPGPNLASWLAEHPEPIPSRVAARLIADLAEGVAHAHTRNVLHRDIKPGNILLAPRIETPNSLADYQPKLTDFGLAKLLETQDATLSGAIVGTPAYMPPEQIAGETSEIGPPVDLYALGMVLYQLLTGSNPFLKHSVGETIHAVTSADLPKPSQVRRSIPRDLETICLKCLRREKQERYSTAADLASDLERYLGGRPIRARNVSPLERALKWIRRYPALTAATFTAFLLLISLLVLSEASRKEAEERELKLLRRTYLDDMQRAGEAWNTNHTDIALETLRSYIPVPGEPDVRDLPWWTIWNEYHDNSRIIGTHAGGATAVACTSMAPYAAFTGGQDAVIKIWSIPDGNQIGELKGHTLGPIQSLELSPDESLLLSAAEDGTVRIWDVRTRSEKMVFREHSGWVAVARFSPDGKKVASAGEDRVIHIWDVASGEVLQTLKGHTDTVRAVAFQPDSEPFYLLVSSSHDRTVRVWNIFDGTPWDSDGKFPDGMLPAKSAGWGDAIEFFNKGRNVFVASVGTWKFSGEERGTQTFSFSDLNPPLPRMRSVQQLLDGRWLWGMGDSSFRIVEEDDEASPHENVSRILRGHLSRDVMDAALFPNDEGFISVCKNGEIRIWSPASLKPAIQIGNRASSSPLHLSWQGTVIDHAHRRGGYIAGGTDAATGARLWSKTVQVRNPKNFIFATHPDRTRAWIWRGDELTCHRPPGKGPLWTKHDEFKTLENQAGPNDKRLLEFDPSGKFAALFYGSHGLILSADSGDLLLTIDLPAAVNGIAFLRHRSSLVAGLHDGTLRIWNLNSLAAASPLVRRMTSGNLNDFNFSSDERFFAILTGDRVTEIFSFPEFHSVGRIPHRTGEEAHKIFLVDSGDTLVSIPSTENRLDFWNVRSRKNHISINLERPRELAISPDRTRLAVETEHGIRFIDGGPRNTEHDR